jgi:hypothetical protein
MSLRLCQGGDNEIQARHLLGLSRLYIVEWYVDDEL